jgi:lipoprotein-anchoring transpeptidase ErfK/SrfK
VTYRRYRTIPPWRRAATFLLLILAAIGAAAAARADEPPGAVRDPGPARIADGVTVAGTLVGGMTGEQAATSLQASFRQPLELTLDGEASFVPPTRLGGIPLVAPAVERALAASSGQDVHLSVLVDRPRLLDYSDRLARRFTQRAVDARARLRGIRPVIRKERAGVTVRGRVLARALAVALRAGKRGPIAVPHTDVQPRVTKRDVWPVIVIRRSTNRLLLYTAPRKKKVLGVATGQPSYPTPLGSFTIVSKQLNPWWYPPASDWAQGLSPVPPGPGNPLGTRWMGLTLPGVGIHGTPDAASIGYSASHGCIRMRIPEAEWLFERVSVGTPVFIVS